MGTCRLWEVGGGGLCFHEDGCKHGFHWYCDACWGGLEDGRAAQSLAIIEDKVTDMVMSSVSQYLDAFRVNAFDTLTSLEVGVDPVMTPSQFSDMLKEALDEWVSANKNEMAGVEVKACNKNYSTSAGSSCEAQKWYQR